MISSAPIVKADAPLVEQWFMLATARAARQGWHTLAARGDLYLELKLPVTQSRSEALDNARSFCDRNPNIVRRLYPKHLFIPINYELLALEGKSRVVDRPEYVPMWPKRMPLCGCVEEAIGRIRITLGKDKDFARKWSGYRFLPVRVDDAVFIPDA